MSSDWCGRLVLYSCRHAEEIDFFVERLTGLGAATLRAVRKDGTYFVVMADPEGNEFYVD